MKQKQIRGFYEAYFSINQSPLKAMSLIGAMGPPVIVNMEPLVIEIMEPMADRNYRATRDRNYGASLQG
jgi:hypothetical protein